jgi:hypothetical protein
LDAELCLGNMEDSDIYYDMHTNYKFYIVSTNSTLKQRFFRQIYKLNERKDWFFEKWLEKPENIQEKLFRYVDLNKWKDNNIKCDKLYLERGYNFMTQEDIFDRVSKLINDNKHIK